MPPPVSAAGRRWPKFRDGGLTSTEAAVREKAAELAKINAEMMVIRAKALAPLAPTLKPEQRELHTQIMS